MIKELLLLLLLGGPPGEREKVTGRVTKHFLIVGGLYSVTALRKNKKKVDSVY